MIEFFGTFTFWMIIWFLFRKRFEAHGITFPMAIMGGIIGGIVVFLSTI